MREFIPKRWWLDSGSNYAGLSGFEDESGNDVSSYQLSNQITDHLADQVVKKLVIKVQPKETVQVNKRGAFLMEIFNKHEKEVNSQTGNEIGFFEARPREILLNEIMFAQRSDQLYLVTTDISGIYVRFSSKEKAQKFKSNMENSDRCTLLAYNESDVHVSDYSKYLQEVVSGRHIIGAYYEYINARNLQLRNCSNEQN